MYVLLSCNHRIDAALDLSRLKRRESEACAPTLDSRDDFVHVVANDAETHVACVLLHDATQGRLSCLGHRICLVQHNQLECILIGTEDVACTSKGLDLATHHLDTAIVGGVEFEDIVPVRLAVETSGQGHDRRRLTCTGRSIEKEVWELICLDKLFDCV